MFEELIFCAARSQELCRKASRGDCSVAKQRKQRCCLLPRGTVPAMFSM